MNYYNENDPKAAAWLRELIREGLISEGVVDERSIVDVSPADLAGYTQCHFFAGIGGWSYALRLAGIPDNEPMWTGSCPCQPFSQAGKQLGTADERHLWPSFARLIDALRPPIVFGEQVASKAGRLWLAGVFADLEAMDYRRAAADLCAAGVGAPHIRQRLYWVANAEGAECQLAGRTWTRRARPSNNIATCGMDHAHCNGTERAGRAGQVVNAGCEASGMVLADSAGREPGRQTAAPARHGDSVESASSNGGLEYPTGNGREQRGTESGGRRVACGCGACGVGDTLHLSGPRLGPHGGQVVSEEKPSGCRHTNPWSRSELLPCADGKTRRIEPGTFPLVDGIPGRVGLLRGYGNAIVPQVAAEFIRAAIEAMHDV